MTYPDTSSQQGAKVSEEGTEIQELEIEIKRDVSYPGEGINVGLTELRAMEAAYKVLEALDAAGRGRAFKWLIEALKVDNVEQYQQYSPTQTDTKYYPTTTGAAETQPTPRDFISQKKPESLVERVACLAYYLTHYRGISHFKTADIVALNTEAAAHRFGNPSRDVDNADRHNGYLVAAGNGKKQITVRGEAVVEALPDREDVRSALKNHPHKPRRSSSSMRKTAAPNMANH